MGSIYQRGSRYWITYSRDGKRVRENAGRTYSQAALRLKTRTGKTEARPRAKIAPGRALDTPTPHRELLDAYLRSLKTYAKPGSARQAGYHVATLKTFFDAHPFNQAGFDALVASLRPGHAPKTVNNVLVTLRAVVNHGINHDLLTVPPFRVRLLKFNRKRVLPILSREDIRKLLLSAREPFRGMLLVAGHTGFRLSEILHLQWSDVYFEESRIAVTSKEGWSPKSHQERACYVPQVLIDYLRRRKEGSKTAWIFPNKLGRSRSAANAVTEIRAVFVRAGLYQKKMPLTHWLRHSVCSHLLASGVDIVTVQKIMGHASITTTQGYAHTTDERMRAAAGKLPY